MHPNSIIQIGVINDIHIPWQDHRALKLVLDIFQDQNIDELIINGDLFDFTNINRHGKKSPKIQFHLEDEFQSGRDFFADIRKRFILNGKKVKFRRGNHDIWLDDYLINQAPAFWNICQLEKMIDLTGIEIFPYNEQTEIYKTNLFIQHSPQSYAKTGPYTSLVSKADSSFIWGCTHREGIATFTGASKNVYRGIFNGWLGSTTLSEEHHLAFKYTKGHENWQKCASILTIFNETKAFINQFSVEEYKACVNGTIYFG